MITAAAFRGSCHGSTQSHRPATRFTNSRAVRLSSTKSPVKCVALQRENPSYYHIDATRRKHYWNDTKPNLPSANAKNSRDAVTSLILLSSRTVANATFQYLLTNNVVPHLTVLLFLAVFSTHLPSLVLCRSHLFPILLPALEKFFHIILPLHDDILARDSNSSVLFMRRRRVEIVDQLRRWMRLPLRLLGQVLVGFEELLGRVLSGCISTIPWVLLVTVFGHVKDICSRRSGDFACSLRSGRPKCPCQYPPIDTKCMKGSYSEYQRYHILISGL